MTFGPATHPRAGARGVPRRLSTWSPTRSLLTIALLGVLAPDATATTTKVAANGEHLTTHEVTKGRFFVQTPAAWQRQGRDGLRTGEGDGRAGAWRVVRMRDDTLYAIASKRIANRRYGQVRALGFASGNCTNAALRQIGAHLVELIRTARVDVEVRRTE